jgi:replicative DNA helicase
MNNQNNQNQDYTRLYADKIERVVLGALLLEQEAYYRVNQILTPEMFMDDGNRVVYATIAEMHKDSKAVDMVTVAKEIIKKNKDVTPVYIASLTSEVISSAHIVQHSMYIKQEHIKRMSISIFQSAIRDLMSETDVSDVLGKSIKSLSEIEEGSIVNNTMKPLREFAKNAIDEAEKRLVNFRSGKFNGIPTFSKQLDKITGGWQNGELIIIAARPAMGKTAIALKILETAAINGCRPAMFALEMKGERLIDRLIIEKTDIEDWKYKHGSMTNEEFNLVCETSNYLYNLDAHIDDCSSQTIHRIKSKARILKKKGQLGMIILDYLQLAEGDTGNTRNEEVAGMSRDLKKMAKDLDVPVIALSQLNRSVEIRGGEKRPQLSDLRDSGAIEQDADMVCFIYRPDYYKLELNINGRPINNGIEFIIAKYREGATGSVYLQHDGTVKNIKDYVPYQSSQFPTTKAQNQESDDMPF